MLYRDQQVRLHDISRSPPCLCPLSKNVTDKPPVLSKHYGRTDQRTDTPFYRVVAHDLKEETTYEILVFRVGLDGCIRVYGGGSGRCQAEGSLIHNSNLSLVSPIVFYICLLPS